MNSYLICLLVLTISAIRVQGNYSLSGLQLVLNCVLWLSSDALDTSSKVEPLARIQGLFILSGGGRGGGWGNVLSQLRVGAGEQGSGRGQCGREHLLCGAGLCCMVIGSHLIRVLACPCWGLRSVPKDIFSSCRVSPLSGFLIKRTMVWPTVNDNTNEVKTCICH